MKSNHPPILIFYICLWFLVSLTHSAHAQLGDNPNRDKPLEITADHTLEWHRNNQQFIANGNVIAKQGNVTIFADTLTADYREADNASFQIYRLTAQGNVRIVSQGNIATGQQAVYDVDTSVAVMIGNNLLLTSPDQSVQAKDSFEYWVSDGRLKAIGSAKVIRGEDNLVADTVSAIFIEDATGTRQLKQMNADGHVKITTPTEILTGKKAQYMASTNIASLFGDVKITRGPNVLTGVRAEVNLDTNVSTIKGSATSGGRVRGVFYPDSSEKNDLPFNKNTSQKPPRITK